MASQYDVTVGNVFDPYDDVPREVRKAGRIRQSGLQRLLSQLPETALEVAGIVGKNMQAEKELNFRKEQLRINEERQKYQDELSTLRLIPEHLRSQVMSKSEYENIRNAGEQINTENKTFQNLLNPVGIDTNIEYFNKIKETPSIANNPSRIAQIDKQIERIVNNNNVKAVKEYYKNKPDNEIANINIQRAMSGEADVVLKEISTAFSKNKNEVTGNAKIEALQTLLKNLQRTGKAESREAQEIRNQLRSLTGLNPLDINKNLAMTISEADNEDSGFFPNIIGGLRGLFASDKPEDSTAPADSTRVELPKVKLIY